MWDLPGPGLEPVSPALAGGFLTSAPPGKSLGSLIFNYLGCFLSRCSVFNLEIYICVQQVREWDYQFELFSFLGRF